MRGQLELFPDLTFVIHLPHPLAPVPPFAASKERASRHPGPSPCPPSRNVTNPSLEPASQRAVEMRNSNSSAGGKQCGTYCSVPSRSSVEEAGPRAPRATHPATCFCLELSFPRTGKVKPEAPKAQRCSPVGGGRASRADRGPTGRLSLAGGRVTSAGRSFPGGVKGRGGVHCPCQFRSPGGSPSRQGSRAQLPAEAFSLLRGPTASANWAPPPCSAAPCISPSPGPLPAFPLWCADPGDFLFSPFPSLLL